MGLAVGLALGLRVRPPHVLTRAGQALLAPGAVLCLASVLTLLQALSAGYPAREFVVFLAAGLSMAAAGVGLWRGARWGWPLAIVAAGVWGVASLVMVVTVGRPLVLMYTIGPALLCTGVAVATREARHDVAPPPPPRRRIMRGGAH